MIPFMTIACRLSVMFSLRRTWLWILPLRFIKVYILFAISKFNCKCSKHYLHHGALTLHKRTSCILIVECKWFEWLRIFLGGPLSTVSSNCKSKCWPSSKVQGVSWADPNKFLWGNIWDANFSCKCKSLAATFASRSVSLPTEF